MLESLVTLTSVPPVKMLGSVTGRETDVTSVNHLSSNCVSVTGRETDVTITHNTDVRTTGHQAALVSLVVKPMLRQ